MSINLAHGLNRFSVGGFAANEMSVQEWLGDTQRGTPSCLAIVLNCRHDAYIFSKGADLDIICMSINGWLPVEKIIICSWLGSSVHHDIHIQQTSQLYQVSMWVDYFPGQRGCASYQPEATPGMVEPQHAKDPGPGYTTCCPQVSHDIEDIVGEK